MLAGLGEAADAMVNCVLWYQCVKIKVGTSMSYILQYDAGNIKNIAASDSHTNISLYVGTGYRYIDTLIDSYPKASAASDWK